MTTSKKAKYIFITFIVGLLFIAPHFASAQSSTETFFVDPVFDFAGREQVDATLRKTGQNTYFYVENGYLNSLNESDKTSFLNNLYSLSLEFDNNIYPKLRETFGSEWKPGIDSDMRITVLISPMHIDIGGYFREEDESLRFYVPISNEREMAYLNTDIVASGKGPVYLAHEFQHLISFGQKQKEFQLQEDRWLNEMRSEYTATLLGYNDVWDGSILEERVGDFLLSPIDSLTDWRGTSADHATVALFAHYLVDKYGIEILTFSMESNSVGIASLNSALAQLDVGKNFSDVFTDWLLALYINRVTSGGDAIYNYANPYLQYDNLHVVPFATYTMNSNLDMRAEFASHDWSGRWLRFLPLLFGEQGGNILEVRIDIFEGTAMRVPYIVTDFSGAISVHFAQVNNNTAIARVEGFGSEILSVVVVPTFQTKFEDFDAASPPSYFNVRAVLNGHINFQDGDLIRTNGASKVYVLKGTSRRWIQSPAIIDFYGHLRWEDIQVVSSSSVDFYTESKLIRMAGDYKVYEVDASGAKHWLDMTPAQFEASGRSWGAIYEVNEEEFNWFKSGILVTFEN